MKDTVSFRISLIGEKDRGLKANYVYPSSELNMSCIEMEPRVQSLCVAIFSTMRQMGFA